MRALIVDHSIPAHLRLAAVPDPIVKPNEALVRVEAVSLNYGEVHHVVPGAEDGFVPGWDAAGVVVSAAADGSGPPVGAPVVTLGNDGAWAELRAVKTDWLAIVPEGIDLGAMSTIPVAAASALRGLRRLGPLLGRRVLITGATGGVGRYAVQLAARGGAHVIAVTGDPPSYAEELQRLGAHDVVDAARLGDVTPRVHGVIDLVGGPQLVAAYGLLEAGSTLVALGHSSGVGEPFQFGDFFGHAGRHERAITTFFLLDSGPGLDTDLAWLAARVAAGELDPQIAWRGDWSRAAEAVAALAGRRVHGKAVLQISRS